MPMILTLIGRDTDETIDEDITTQRVIRSEEILILLIHSLLKKRISILEVNVKKSLSFAGYFRGKLK